MIGKPTSERRAAPRVVAHHFSITPTPPPHAAAELAAVAYDTITAPVVDDGDQEKATLAAVIPTAPLLEEDVVNSSQKEETRMPEQAESLADAVGALERDHESLKARYATVTAEAHQLLAREKAYLGIVHAISDCSYEEIRAAAEVYGAWGAPDAFDRSLRKLAGGPMVGRREYPVICDHVLEVVRAAAIERIATSQAHRERLRALKIQRDRRTGLFKVGVEVKGKFKPGGGEDGVALEKAMREGRDGWRPTRS